MATIFNTLYTQYNYTSVLQELRTYTIYWENDESPDDVERGCWALKGKEDHWQGDPRMTDLEWMCGCLDELWEEDNYHNTWHTSFPLEGKELNDYCLL